MVCREQKNHSKTKSQFSAYFHDAQAVQNTDSDKIWPSEKALIWDLNNCRYLVDICRWEADAEIQIEGVVQDVGEVLVGGRGGAEAELLLE